MPGQPTYNGVPCANILDIHAFRVFWLWLTGSCAQPTLSLRWLMRSTNTLVRWLMRSTNTLTHWLMQLDALGLRQMRSLWRTAPMALSGGWAAPMALNGGWAAVMALNGRWAAPIALSGFWLVKFSGASTGC
jgi:hypothetical protein